MDFNLPPEIEALRLKLREFVAEEVMPLEEIRTTSTNMRT